MGYIFHAQFYKPTTRSFLKAFWAHLMDYEEEDPANLSPVSTDVAHRMRKISKDPSQWLKELNDLEAQGFQPELVFIDTGLVTVLEGANRKNFIDLFRAIAEFDGYKAGHLMVERCRTPELVIDPETFALRIQHLVLEVKSQTFTLGKIQISEVLTKVLSYVRQHHVRMEGDFINTVLSILLLEGIGRQLDPNLDLFKSALPILRQIGKRMKAEDVRGSMSDGSFAPMLKVSSPCFYIILD